jgi:hypothetical protein
VSMMMSTACLLPSPTVVGKGWAVEPGFTAIPLPDGAHEGG